MSGSGPSYSTTIMIFSLKMVFVFQSLILTSMFNDAMSIV